MRNTLVYNKNIYFFAVERSTVQQNDAAGYSKDY